MPNDEIKTLLEANLKKTEEVLEISKKIHRDVIWRRISKAVWYGIIVVFMVIGFIQIQPYFDEINIIVQQSRQIIGSLPETIKNIQQVLPR